MGSSTSVTPAPAESGKFIELDVLTSASGTRAIITQRIANGLITFSIVRVFQRDGVDDWTSFFSEAQIKDFEEMLVLVKKRIAELRDDPKVRPLSVAGRVR
jgi:hypothetical protein